MKSLTTIAYLEVLVEVLGTFHNEVTLFKRFFFVFDTAEVSA